MKRLTSIILNLVFFLQVLLVFLLLFENRIELPPWLQVVGRLHPAILHIPIGLFVFLVFLIFFRSQFNLKQFRRFVLLILMLGSIFTSLTALFGFFLSVGGDYGSEKLSQHKLSGVALSFLFYLLLAWYKSSKKKKFVLNTSVFFSFLVLVFVGHTGSILTHGEDYVLGPLKKNDKVIDIENASLYQLAIVQVLERKCFSCHNESKAKGKLIMTSREKFIAGGESGKEWVEGYPDSSRLIQNIHLPLEDDDHMPPEGKPQLSAHEIKLLEAWIKSGADFDKKFVEFAEDDSLRILTAVLIKTEQNLHEEKYTFKAADPKLIEGLNTSFRSVFPLYQNSPALQVDFFVKQFFNKNALDDLKDIREQVVVINLSGMPIDDNDLKKLAEFPNLEKLNLNFTGIKGEGLKSLTNKNLGELSLAGLPVTKDHLVSVLQLPVMKKVFIWNTKVTDVELEDLKTSYPTIEFYTSEYKDLGMLALSKPILLSEGILKKGEALNLKHTMPGVTIRYSIDGSKVDSISGNLYDKPIEVNETVKLLAVACKEGWYCSYLLEATVYVEGIKPKEVTLLTPPDKQYPGEGATSLTDGRKGLVDILKEPSWLGFRDNNFEAGFDFGDTTPTIKKIVLSYADNLGGYVFPPTQVEIWGGNESTQLKLLKSEQPDQPSAYRPSHLGMITVSFEPSHYSYYKIVAKPLSKLPEWHGGKGQKGWFFVDEVFFY